MSATNDHDCACCGHQTFLQVTISFHNFPVYKYIFDQKNNFQIGNQKSSILKHGTQKQSNRNYTCYLNSDNSRQPIGINGYNKSSPQFHILIFIYTPSFLLCEVKVIQSCPTLCDPMDYTVHGILQARILEWVAISFSGGSSQPRDRTQISCIAGGFFVS